MRGLVCLAGAKVGLFCRCEGLVCLADARLDNLACAKGGLSCRGKSWFVLQLRMQVRELVYHAGARGGLSSRCES